MAPRKTAKHVKPRVKPGPKPRAKRVPMSPEFLARSSEAVCVDYLRKHAPHLLAETKPLGDADARVGTTIIRGEDVVNHPSHYKGANGIECIDCQEAAVGDSGLTGFQAHLIATIIGYAFRCGKKDSALQDARKLRWYADKLVSTLEKES